MCVVVKRADSGWVSVTARTTTSCVTLRKGVNHSVCETGNWTTLTDFPLVFTVLNEWRALSNEALLSSESQLSILWGCGMTGSSVPCVYFLRRWVFIRLLILLLKRGKRLGYVADGISINVLRGLGGCWRGGIKNLGTFRTRWEHFALWLT